MNNEEKILALLESMQTDITELKAGQAKLADEVADLKTGQAKLEAGQRRIRKDVSEVKFEIKEGLWDETERLYKRVEK